MKFWITMLTWSDLPAVASIVSAAVGKDVMEREVFVRGVPTRDNPDEIDIVVVDFRGTSDHPLSSEEAKRIDTSYDSVFAYRDPLRKAKYVWDPSRTPRNSMNIYAKR